MFGSKIITLVLLIALFLPSASNVFAQTSDELLDDYTYYQKYKLYLPYEKKLLYRGYLKYEKNKKFRFKTGGEKARYQAAYENYLLYKENPSTYPQYAKLKKQYLRYRSYKAYLEPYEQYKGYKKYKRYNNKKYDKGKAYGGPEYKAGYERYLAAQASAGATIGEADLPSGILVFDGNRVNPELGPEVSVGLVSYTKQDLKDASFQIKAFSASTGAPLDYVIRDKNNAVLATISAAAAERTTKVKYLSDKTFTLYNSTGLEAPSSAVEEIRFEAADPTKQSDIVFDFNRPSSDFDQYRGKMKLRYWSNPDGADEIWAINTLPLEQYVWGMGEMTGTGPSQHSQVMTTVFRTYGYWKIKFSTKFSSKGFKVNATPGNQLYYGYDWEKKYPDIRKAAEATQGHLVMYLANSTNEIALTPYSSWTDGKTRSFQQRWGSTAYPWCQSVSDPYGKHPTLSTTALEEQGNHMVGLSANGSLKMAGDKYKKNWQEILNYYFKKINLRKAY